MFRLIFQTITTAQVTCSGGASTHKANMFRLFQQPHFIFSVYFPNTGILLQHFRSAEPLNLIPEFQKKTPCKNYFILQQENQMYSLVIGSRTEPVSLLIMFLLLLLAFKKPKAPLLKSSMIFSMIFILQVNMHMQQCF